MTLTPETAALMEGVRAAGGKPFHSGTVEEGRAAVAAFFALPNPAPDMARIDRQDIDGPAGPLPVIVLTPPGPVLGRILFAHGGGWVCGTAEDHVPVASQIAAATGCAVAVPDYRLAPEHPAPAAVDDCAAALNWFGAGTSLPVFVMGDSAGGNIAAVLAHRARDGAGPALAGQVLIYPITDTDIDRPSYTAPDNQQILTRADMEWFIGHYAPDPARRRDPAIAPLHSPDFSDLPPAQILLAGHDPLQDEGRAYADALTGAGVQTELIIYPGDIHGFLVLGGQLASTGRMIHRIGTWVRERCASTAAVG